MKTSVVAALGAGLIVTLGALSAAQAATTTILDVSEQGSGISVVSSPVDDLAAATSATTTSWGLPDTFTLLPPLSGTVTSFVLSNPVELSPSALGANTLTIVIGGVTYTDSLTETANPFGQVKLTGELVGGTLGANVSELSISYTQSGGTGNGISASATYSVTTSTVPEPSTWAMMMLGFAGLGYAAFRRASKSRVPAIAA
jgi:PEP-CTERM motif